MWKSSDKFEFKTKKISSGVIETKKKNGSQSFEQKKNNYVFRRI